MGTVGLGELRQNLGKYAREVRMGKSFRVTRYTKPLFVISPVAERTWEAIVDFKKLKKGGVEIDDLLSRL